MGVAKGSAQVPPVGPVRAWVSVAIIVVMMMLSYIDRSALSLFAPMVQRDLLISDGQMGVLFGVGFIIPLALVTLLAGRLVDHLNRVGIMLSGLFFWSVMTALCGLVGSYPGLLIARGGVGAGEAVLGPAAYSLVGDLFPSERRGRAIGIVAASASVGSGIALLAGGALIQALGPHDRVVPLLGALHNWQLGFVLLGAVGVPVVVLGMILRDPRGRAVAAADSAAQRGLLAHIVREPLRFIAILGCAVLNVAVGIAAMAWGPTLLVRSHGLAPADAGYLLGLVTLIGGVLGAPAGAELSDFCLRRNVRGGRLLSFTALFPILLCGVLLVGLASGYEMALGGYFAINIAIAGISAVGFAAIQDASPPHLRGRALSLLQLAALLIGYGVGPILVPLVTDTLLGGGGSIGEALIFIGVPMSLIAIGLSIAAASAPDNH